jgi:hypothetical protein
MSLEADRRSLELLIVELLDQRGPDSTLCPSDVAKAASADEWRMLMPAVRMAACRLAAEQTIEITQGGQVINAESTWRGPVRLRRGSKWSQQELFEARA